MHGFEIGQQVKLATMEQVIFTVTMINPDGSYVIEAALSTEQTLTYSNVTQEMLRLVEMSQRSLKIYGEIELFFV